MNELERARQMVRAARRLCVLTGAGISAESGVPTFRGDGHSLVWRGMPFEELSSARMIRKNLPLVWEWFDYRLGVVGECLPNAGHYGLADAQKSGRFEEFALVTQNIDRLHRDAGSADIIELHGNIWQARCTVCMHLGDTKTLPEGIRPPVCPECNALMRPNVVLFGEYLDEDKISTAQDRASRADVCLVIGTSALVYPASELPLITQRAGGAIIEINREETILTGRTDVSIRGRSAEAIPAVFEP